MFFRGTLFDLALDYKPLLYALVGFAAYHYSLEKPDGKMYEFLKYYDRSLQLLRKSLASGEKHTEAMLATVLQLSTFEVCSLLYYSDDQSTDDDAFLRKLSVTGSISLIIIRLQMP